MEKALGIDFGATNIRIALGDRKGRLEEAYSERTNDRKITEQFYKIIDRYSDFDAIGIAATGPLDTKNGIIIAPPNLKIKNLRIINLLEKRYGIECELFNDCIAGVYGEKAHGIGKSVKNFAYITFSTGIGCGVIQNNELVLGKDGNAHEVGHCSVDGEMRFKCGCGSMGRHWESYTGGKNITRFVRHLLKTKYKNEGSVLNKNSQRLTPELFFKIANKDKTAKQILRDIGRINSSGIGNVINSYDPELIAIGGAVALNNPRAILDPIKRYIKEYAINRIPKMALTRLDHNAILIGAIAKVLRNKR